jgi:hypothetical protein
MRSSLVALVLVGSLASCAAVESALDYPMSFFDDETGESTEVALGDVVADHADGVGSVVSNALSGINPLVALLGGGAATALLGGARRKRKAALVSQAKGE